MFLHFKNKALKKLIGDDYMAWTGDLFVHKVASSTGTMLDVLSEDLDDITELLRR